MYKKYFGLLDEPFRMTPDTRYLFRSIRHEEAISSLQYGIGERKGFIVITGEIGTGKTTLCRALLNQLDANIKTAIVLNPSLSRVELLHAIIDDLGIKCEGENPSQKALMDKLNDFLIAQTQEGRNVAVIIDEAQNLDTDVLEFIRMLSNLETEQEKLLQIILVGQPELNEVLKMDKLEQLRQRIAVRYHITPLDTAEILQYIRHRLMVAGNEKCVEFLPEAIDAIDEYTGGIPRLINIICDKCLLAAYACNTREIDEEIARKAIADHEGPSLQQREDDRRGRESSRSVSMERRPARPAPSAGDATSQKRTAVAVGIVVAVAVAALLAAKPGRSSSSNPVTSPTAVPPAATEASLNAVHSAPPARVRSALEPILERWGIEQPALSISEAGLVEVRILADLPTLARIGLPALIPTEQTDLALIGANPTTYTIFDPTLAEPIRRFPRLQFDRIGLIQARIPLPANWAYPATKNDPRTVELLSKALRHVRPETNWALVDSRGVPAAEAVTAFQAAIGLPTDGIIGPMTWCALVSKAHPEFPSLTL